MRKLALIALIAIAGGAFYLIRDVGHIPLFDANLQVLAESEVEGYCAGFVADRFNKPHDKPAADCRAANADLSDAVNYTTVQKSGCLGYAKATNKPSDWVTGCTSWMQREKFWPTRDGRITNNWSPTAPYPLDVMFDEPPTDSRTGTRDGFSRDDEAPTTTTTEGAE
jgi:hypothetical protein